MRGEVVGVEVVIFLMVVFIVVVVVRYEICGKDYNIRILYYFCVLFLFKIPFIIYIYMLN